MMLTTGLGLLCPACGGAELAVKDSRAGPDCIRRRRRCPCGAPRVTTIETIIGDAGQGHRHKFVFDASAVLVRLSPSKRALVMNLIYVLAGAPGEEMYPGLEKDES
jgi:hypothetical protein